MMMTLIATKWSSSSRDSYKGPTLPMQILVNNNTGCCALAMSGKFWTFQSATFRRIYQHLHIRIIKKILTCLQVIRYLASVCVRKRARWSLDCARWLMSDVDTAVAIEADARRRFRVVETYTASQQARHKGYTCAHTQTHSHAHTHNHTFTTCSCWQVPDHWSWTLDSSRVGRWVIMGKETWRKEGKTVFLRFTGPAPRVVNTGWETDTSFIPSTLWVHHGCGNWV